MRRAPIRIGTAGWAIRPEHRLRFRQGASILARYATRLNAVEINSSFYRPHRRFTYERWAASVPEDFRFAVKAPKTVTHECKLRDTEPLLDRFLEETAGLGDKLGPLLFQLPPKLAFDAVAMRAFLSALRVRFAGAVVLEPRHPSWFEAGVEDLLKAFRIARAGADPARCMGAECPGGWEGVRYWRLHGAPRMYYDAYAPAALKALAPQLPVAAAAGGEAWCIFDNTALGHATANALELAAFVTVGGERDARATATRARSVPSLKPGADRLIDT